MIDAACHRSPETLWTLPQPGIAVLDWRNRGLRIPFKISNFRFIRHIDSLNHSGKPFILELLDSRQVREGITNRGWERCESAWLGEIQDLHGFRS